MRILTWNVNGLATTLQYHPWSDSKSYKVLLDTLASDILCFQEVKCQRTKLTREMALVPGYDGYFSFSKVKLGYSGVVIYLKHTIAPPHHTYEGITGILDNSVSEDMEALLSTMDTSAECLDAEGRCLILDMGVFVLFNVYLPNSTTGTFKMDYCRCVKKRIQFFLDQQRQVVLVGDINAIAYEIDHCDPHQSLLDNHIAHFDDLPHRQWFKRLLTPQGPLIDTTRYFHPHRTRMFTCWNTRMNARSSNYGTRIDYILVSQGLEKFLRGSDIQPDVMGSDHCPVYTDFDMDLSAATHKETTTAASTAEGDLESESSMTTATTKKSRLLSSTFPEFSNRLLSNYFSFTPKRRAPTVPVVQKKAKTQQQLTIPDIPLCRRHHLPCVARTVTKKGPNQGRVFYVCSKPIGPQDQPEDYSCNHFQWKHSK